MTHNFSCNSQITQVVFCHVIHLYPMVFIFPLPLYSILFLTVCYELISDHLIHHKPWLQPRCIQHPLTTHIPHPCTPQLPNSATQVVKISEFRTALEMPYQQFWEMFLREMFQLDRELNDLSNPVSLLHLWETEGITNHRSHPLLYC